MYINNSLIVNLFDRDSTLRLNKFTYLDVLITLV